MANAWHREEPREVRPFFLATKAKDALVKSGIRLFENTDVLDDVKFDLDEPDFQKLAPVIKIDVVDPAQWLSPGLSKSDLELVLIARHSFLKRAETIHRTTLDVPLPDEWVIDAETLDNFAGGRNLELTLAICLADDRDPIPGQPFVQGHWLAIKSFTLRTRNTPNLFDVRTRTDEEWIAAGFPAKTTYAISYSGGIETQQDEGSSVATVWVHIDAHNKMTSSSLGEVLQPFLASEIVCEILVGSKKDLDGIETVEAGSPLATILKQLGKEKPMSLDGLKELVAKPSMLKATLQDRLAVLSALK